MAFREYKVKAALRSKILRQWVGATLLGGILALASSYLFTTVIQPALPQVNFVVIAITLNGLIVGTCQWRVLRQTFRRSYRWMAITTLGLYLTGFLQALAAGIFQPYVSYPPLTTLLYGIIGCFVLGTFQSLFFLGEVKGAWNWVLFRAIATGCFALLASPLLLVLILRAESTSSAPGAFTFVLVPVILVAWPLWWIVEGTVTGILLFNFANQKANQKISQKESLR